MQDKTVEQNALQLLGEGYKEDITIDNVINGDGTTRDITDCSNYRSGELYIFYLPDWRSIYGNISQGLFETKVNISLYTDRPRL